MDPQIRLLLETVYEATEDAGIPIDKLAGTNTSVFSGCYGKDYCDQLTRDPEAMPPSFLTGNYTAMMSNRISHFYDLQGASMSIDTGCSAGLACLHQGCLTIRNGESDVSIVGASSTMLNADLFMAMSNLGMVGADGRCYAWDQRAQGYGRGEGVAALVLKSLEAARRDGDRVHAVIRDTGLNQDGKTQTITSPSIDSQVRLIRQCYERAGIRLSDTGYIEAHMTGTQTGDLAEATALARTFGASRGEPECGEPVLVGSVKTSVGHTEGVSGLAAIIKAAFAMRRRQIPANLNYDVPNAKIKLDEWNLKVPRSLTPWPTNKPLRTSINNFGYGGTNAHVILEAAPSNCTQTNGDGANFKSGGLHEKKNVSGVFIISARDGNAARTMAVNLATHLRDLVEAGNDIPMGDLAYTLADRRSRMDHVVVVRASSPAELADRLHDPALKVSTTPARKPRLGFVFNGQGAQWHAMGRELLNTYPIFASAIQEADAILRSYGADWSLRDELMRDAATTRVSEIHLSQPVTVALQICLVQLLASWGVRPSAVVSHSSGEIAAGVAAGALSVREALGVVYLRGQLARKYQDLSPSRGAMAAAGIGPDDAARYIASLPPSRRVVVACVNSPESVTLSGDADGIDEIMSLLDRDGVFARKLKVTLAYHSHHMLPMAPEYAEQLRQLLPPKATIDSNITFSSPVTGGIIDPAEGLSSNHWVTNLTSPVLFSTAFEAISDKVDTVVEIGPHSTLSGPIRQISKDRGEVRYVSCLKRGTNAVETMQDLTCALLAHGYPMSLSDINKPLGESRPQFVPGLPAYVWNHSTRYWVESRVNQDTRNKRFPPHELIGSPVSGGSPLIPEWRNFLRLADVPWLADHRVDSQTVLPGAAYISMAIEAVALVSKEAGLHVHGYLIRDAEFLSALTIPESAAVELRLRLEPVDSISGEYDFRISSLGPSGIWAENSQGRIVVITQLDASRAHKDEALGEVADGGRTIDVGELLARMRDMSIEYGPSFQNLTSGRSKETRSVMNLRLSEVTANGDSYIVHPTTLDCIVQATYAALSDELTKTSIVLPRSVHGLFVPSSLQAQHVEELVVSTNLKQAQQSGVSSEVTVFNAADNASQSPLRIGRLFCQAIPRRDIEIPADAGTEVLRYKSTWTPDVLYSKSEPSIESTMHNTLASEDIAFERKMIRASYYFVVAAIGKIEKDDDMSGWTEKARVLFEWMKSTIMRGERGEFGSGSSRLWLRASPGMKQALFDEIKRGNSRAQLLHRVGSRLAEMVRSPVASQELPSLEVDSSSRDLVLRDFPIMTQIIKVIKRITLMAPGAKVLEIGAGSGSVAEAILEALSPTKTRRATLLELYCLCEPLPQLLDAARQKLARWGDLIDFRNHDMNRDLVEGLGDDAIGSFDLVILPSMRVDHFGDPRKALAGIARLLRPAGKLMLVEPSQHKLDQQLLSTFLPRWPLNIGVSTDASRVTTWDAVLRESGFTGDDLRLEDCEQPEFQNHGLVLTTLALPPVPQSSVHLVTTETVPAQWIKDLVAAVRATGSTVVVEKWDTSFSVKEDGLYIFTGDMDTPCLESLDQASFSRLQELLKRSAAILWLSCGGLVDSQSPLHAQSQGFLRTLRLEDPSKRLIHLDFELSASGPWTADNTGHVARVLQYSFHESVRAEETDWEFAVKDNVLHVQRVYFKEEESPTSDEPVKRPFHGSDDMVVWQPARSIFLSGDTSLSTGIPAGMVDIEVRGFDPQPYYTSDSGNESVGYHRISGIVKGVRPDGADFHKLRVGDRVGGIASGPIANVTRVAGSHIIGIPSAMSFVDAVCVPTAYATAYHALYTVAGLRCGASVLIHNASEHVSQAAIVVAQHLGANVFAITHDAASAELLVNTFGLSSDHVFSATDMSLGIQIQDKAVDVVFGTSTMPRYGLLQGALTRFGRLVWVGNDDVFSDRAWGNMHFVGSSTSYSFLDMGEMAKYDHNAFRSALEASMRVYSNAMSNVPSLLFTAQYPASRIQEAVRLQEQKDDSSTAAVIIVAEPDDLVDVIVSPKITSLVKPQSTYLIVGGLGGIGREICSWMMGSGARNVLLVSRNAEDHPEAKLLMEIAGEKQCKLFIKNCDVSSERQLAMLLTDVETTMPPIDGVIHAGMVLEDSIFERMTFDQWKRATGSKVAATMNLDRQLPDNMSFFILLSSLTGVIGHPSQSNYAAGNTFQDAFARHRTAQGRYTTAIDLSAVSDAGIVASDEEARRRVEALGTRSLRAPSILTVLDEVMRRSPLASEGQMIINLSPWTELTSDAPLRRDRRFGTLRSAPELGPPDTETDSSNDEQLTPSALLAKLLADARNSSGSSSGDPDAILDDVVRVLAARLAAIFNIDAQEIDARVPLASHGVDSLVAVELRNWLVAAGRVKMSIFEILQAASLYEIASLILSRI